MNARLFTCMGVISLTFAWATPAMAQLDQFMQWNQPEEDPVPPQELPPMPEGAVEQVARPDAPPQPDMTVRPADYYQQQQRQFPQLPPSRPCTAKDLVGIWKLATVYEEPLGPETTNFHALPNQYFMYKKDSIYGKYNAPTSDLPAVMVMDEINKRDDGLHQYLVNESGIVYYYNQGVAVDSQACFIVANEREPFYIGQMILMPPKGSTTTRLVKLYNRISSQDEVRPTRAAVRRPAAAARQETVLPPPSPRPTLDQRQELPVFKQPMQNIHRKRGKKRYRRIRR